MNILRIKFFFIFICFVTSCVTKKEIVYFQDTKDFYTAIDTNTFSAKLKVGDEVSIIVSTFDPAMSAPYNALAQAANQGGGAGGQMMGYIIDVDGYIDFPVLGKIKLNGLTVNEARELFKKKFEEDKLLKDPVILVRILNYRVVIDGAVNAPGVYSVSGDQMNILEGLARAGGLAITARRDNILVVRDFDGSKTYFRVDLTSKEVFNSPVYYLTQNDYIYVEPNNSAISRASGDSRLTSILGVTGTILGLILVFVSVN